MKVFLLSSLIMQNVVAVCHTVWAYVGARNMYTVSLRDKTSCTLSVLKTLQSVIFL